MSQVRLRWQPQFDPTDALEPGKHVLRPEYGSEVDKATVTVKMPMKTTHGVRKDLSE